MSKSLLIIIGIVVVAAGLWYGFSVMQNPGTSPLGSGKSAYAPIPTGQGRVVFALKDAAEASMQGATSILVTIDKVEAHNATQGWITVSTTTKQYDLLQLKQSGAVALLADANLAAGTYDQIRLDISTVDVITASGHHTAKLPSHMLKIVGDTVVTADHTSTVSIDFIADKSLHLTGKGVFILAPVVKLETKSDTRVDIDSDEHVTVKDGRVESETNEGMDEKGETKVDFELKGELDVDTDNMIRIKDGEKMEGEIQLNLTMQNNSGVSGTATLHEEDGKVTVTLKTNQNSVLGLIPPPAEPAHIHIGSCPNPGSVKYPLHDVMNGKSETVLNISLAQLKAQMPSAINVHKSSSEINTYIACGDIKF